MCGIFSIVTKNSNGFTMENMKMLEQMLCVSALRGADSTGLFAVSRNKMDRIPMIHKNVGDPYYFLNNKDFHKPMLDLLYKEGFCVVGHTRSATVGNISIKNAHPFRHKNITLVHNGTLGGEKSVNKEAEVDSHHLCINIAENGYKEALKATVGAYALIWYDTEEQKLFISRNTQRPLWQLVDGQSRYIMSEEEALVFLAKRNKIHLPVDSITYFKEHNVYSIDKTGQLKIECDISEERGHYYYPRREPTTYTPPTTIRSPASSKLVTFIVDSIFPSSKGPVKYACTGEENERVYFYTKFVDEALIGKIGTGQVVNEVYTSGENEPQLFVRFRGVTWQDKVENPKVVKLISHNNVQIEKEEWKKMVKESGCASCLNPIGEEDCHKTTVDPVTKKMLCETCKEAVGQQGISQQSAVQMLS